MSGSRKRDIALLTVIGKYQTKIEKALEHFGCRSAGQLRDNELALDLCAMYVAQIGEACKSLTEESRQALTCVKPDIMRYYRNMISHVYEKVNKDMLAAYAFDLVCKDAVQEIRLQIKKCMVEEKYLDPIQKDMQKQRTGTVRHSKDKKR